VKRNGIAALATLLLTATVLCASPGRAQEGSTVTQPLGLDAVLASVERSFPLIKAAEVEQALAAADLLSAEGGFDISWKTRGALTPLGYYDSVRVESLLEQPTSLWGLSAFAGWKLGTGKFPSYDGRQQTLEYGELRAGVNVPIVRNGPIDRRRASLGRAALGINIAALTVSEQRIQYRRAGAHRYWAWVAAGRRLAIAQELLRNVEGRDAGLGERVARGDLARIERTDNARAVEQRKAQVALAQRGVEQASIELSLFLRDREGHPLPPPAESLPPNFPEPGPGPIANNDIAFALSARPEAQRFQLQLRQNQIELDWAKNQLALGIDLQLAGSRDFGRSLLSRPDLSQSVFEVSLLLDIPIQTNFMQGRRDAAAATVLRLGHQQAFAQDRIEADVRDAHSGMRGAQDRIAAAKQEVKLALELEQAERTRFEQGDSHLLIVNLREQQTAEAELREIEAYLDYHRAVADLKAARGE
jgi:outer membrane protein, heavy metal efflux system